MKKQHKFWILFLFVSFVVWIPKIEKKNSNELSQMVVLGLVDWSGLGL